MTYRECRRSCVQKSFKTLKMQCLGAMKDIQAGTESASTPSENANMKVIYRNECGVLYQRASDSTQFVRKRCTPQS
jgi:hypothetical protein